MKNSNLKNWCASCGRDFENSEKHYNQFGNYCLKKDCEPMLGPIEYIKEETKPEIVYSVKRHWERVQKRCIECDKIRKITEYYIMTPSHNRYATCVYCVREKDRIKNLKSAGTRMK